MAVALRHNAPSPPYANHTRPPYTNHTYQINSLAIHSKTLAIVSTKLVIGTTSDFVTYCPKATTLTVTKCDQGKCSRTQVTVADQETVSLSGFILTLASISTQSVVVDESTAKPTTFKTLTISRPNSSWIINPPMGPPFQNTSSGSLPKTTMVLSSTVAASSQPQPLSNSSTIDDDCSSTSPLVI